MMLIVFSTSVYATSQDASESSPQVQFNGTTVVVDYPASLDAYLICYEDNKNELWHMKLYSYDVIQNVNMSLQKVRVEEIIIEDSKVKVTDSRGMIYYVDPQNGKLLSTDDSNYRLPDFTDVSQPNVVTDKNGIIKYVAFFGVVIGIVLIVFIASRGKKQ